MPPKGCISGEPRETYSRNMQKDGNRYETWDTSYKHPNQTFVYPCFFNQVLPVHLEKSPRLSPETELKYWSLHFGLYMHSQHL